MNKPNVVYMNNAEVHIEQMRAFARSNNSIESFEHGITRVLGMGMPRDGRPRRIKLAKELLSKTDIYWELESQDAVKPDVWHYMGNGGLNYHVASNEWSINT